MEPQTTNFPGSAPSDAPVPQTPQIPQKDNHGITIAAMAVFVLLSLAAVAFLYYQNQQLKNMLISYQSSPTPSATPDVTANWKTYTNTVYGIEFKHPLDWQISGGGVDQKIFLGLALSGQQTYDVLFSTTDNPQKLDIATYVTNFLNSQKGQPGGIHFDSQENITLANRPAVILHNVFAFDRGLEEIYIASGNKVLVISYPTKTNNPSLLNPVANYDIVQQILSTFQFISPSPTPISQ